MGKRCVSTPGPGRCCQAMQSGVRPGQSFQFTDSRGHARCASCEVIQRTKGRGPGFRFRFLKGSVCGIGPGGCTALAATNAASIMSPQF